VIEISFARTTPALLAGAKTVTRRVWKPKHTAKFTKGRQFTALDKDRRYGGKPIAVCEMIEDAHEEPTREIPDSDWEAEGFAYMEANGLLLNDDLECAKQWRLWRQSDKSATVVRFKLIRVIAQEVADGQADA
jgi:hypothetical protein